MLEIKNLCKRYGQTQALDNVQLSVGRARSSACSEKTVQARRR